MNIMVVALAIPLIHRLKSTHKFSLSSLSNVLLHNRRIHSLSAMENASVDEGKAHVIQPPAVFYNPVQEFNRDLTIAVLTEFAKDHFSRQENAIIKKKIHTENTLSSVNENKMDKSEAKILGSGIVHENGLTIFEGLSASGLRSIRFALEVPGVKQILANDFNKTAVEYIEKNISHNKVQQLVTANYGDAAMVMYQHRGRDSQFDVIDLDPYGSAAQFLDAAVQSVNPGGLLCVTCTDAAVLCAVAPETCFAKYGAMPVRAKFCHEAAVRIMLQSIERQANRYSRYIEPLLSMSADFYFRVFVRVHQSAKAVKSSCMKQSYFYHCGGCGAFHLQPVASREQTSGDNYKYSAPQGPSVPGRCDQCNSHMRMGGPIWSHPMHDTDFLRRVIASVKDDPERFATSDRIIGMLSVMSEELPDVPLYYEVDDLMSKFRCMTPKSSTIRSAILNAGYRVSDSHAAKNVLKTDAPPQVLFDIFRCWRKDGVQKAKVEKSAIAVALMSKEPKFKANFDLHPDADPKSKTEHLVRYQQNPVRDWGPKAKASYTDNSSLEERRLRGMLKSRGKRHLNEQVVDFKQFQCKRFKAGECDLGDECKYSHGLEPEENEQPSS